MATFEITEGAPGQGKSLYTAKKARYLLERNKKWFLKSGFRRVIWSNMKFSEEFEQECGFGTDETFLMYWSDSFELCKLSDCDILWDEIATELDARNFANLSIEMKRFLSQYRKRGIDIFANTQDFSMIDVRARLMISGVRTLKKVVGSQDISTTKPKPKMIWGLIFVREVTNFREVNPDKKIYSLFDFSIFFITKELISLYDTRQDISLGKQPLLKHTELYCEDENCSFHKTMHQ